MILTESTSAGVIWVGQGQGRTRLACWLLLLMKSVDLRTATLQNIFLNCPLSSKQSKEISTGPTKPGQIRTTRSSKLITRSEADMASVEGNWVILYKRVIARELWQCWFWTTQVQFLILPLLQPQSQWTTKCWPGNHRCTRGKVRQWVEVLMTGCYHICSNPHLLTQENYIALLLTSLLHSFSVFSQNCNLLPEWVQFLGHVNSVHRSWEFDLLHRNFTCWNAEAQRSNWGVP